MKKFLSGLFGGGGKEPLTPEAYWDWFAENADSLIAKVQSGDQGQMTKAVGEIGAKIDRVNSDLAFELGRHEDGTNEFIVSAEGIKAVFPAVTELVAAAPPIPGWRIIAFRPRQEQRDAVQYGGLSLGIDEIYYRSNPVEGKIDIVVCLPGYSEETHGALIGIAFLSMDQVLGEYDVATKIGEINLEPLPDDPATAGLKPLRNLAAEVDGYYDGSTQ